MNQLPIMHTPGYYSRTRTFRLVNAGRQSPVADRSLDQRELTHPNTPRPWFHALIFGLQGLFPGFGRPLFSDEVEFLLPLASRQPLVQLSQYEPLSGLIKRGVASGCLSPLGWGL